ncbi:MAG: DEAD/DEAH box helicase, partial [Clostridia bacterium]|nr:DEAD/DEAH box helicase [Clostridia bacterium]
MKPDAVLESFHPAVQEWFSRQIGTPSQPQVLGWPIIQSGQNVLISAPTGAGKTLAAFLESIDVLLKRGLENDLPEGIFILYVSPLKALNNDIYKNLDVPLEGIKRCCTEKGISFPDIRKAVRTGDTPQQERQRMLKHPPHILITT